jgi:hypothetical protein
MMDCQSYQIEIEELEASERPGDETTAHLSTCEACRAFYAERQSLRRLVSEMEPVSAPADFDFRLRARLAASNGAGNHGSSWRSFVFSAPAIGLTASLVLLGVVATAFYNRSRPVPIIAGRPAEVVRQKPVVPNITQSINAPVETMDSKTSTEATIKKNDNPIVAAASDGTRQSRAPSGKVNPLRNQTSATSNSGQRLSNDYSASRAPVITPYAGPALPVVGASPLVEVSVRSKSQPLKISFDDRSGIKRTVTLEPVVFGSQDVAGRETSRISGPDGIW